MTDCYCEYCCNFDKEHIGMDGTALCELTNTLAYCEESAEDCKFFNIPAADVQEVKLGKWGINTDEYDCEYMMCSVCKEEFYPGDADTVDTTPNYCPNCGAKMNRKDDT